MSLNGNIIMFAADTALVSSGCLLDKTYSTASSDLLEVKKWLGQNTLTFNITKTKYMPIFFRRVIKPVKLTY